MRKGGIDTGRSIYGLSDLQSEVADVVGILHVKHPVLQIPLRDRLHIPRPLDVVVVCLAERRDHIEAGEIHSLNRLRRRLLRQNAPD